MPTSALGSDQILGNDQRAGGGCAPTARVHAERAVPSRSPEPPSAHDGYAPMPRMTGWWNVSPKTRSEAPSRSR